MFDKLEKLFTDLVSIVKTRVEKLESGFSGVKDDVGTLKADLASARDEVTDLKAEIADMKKAAADLSGFQAAVDGLKGGAPSITEPAQDGEPDPAPDPKPDAPVVTEAPSGAMVTVDPVVGATTHEDVGGVVTTVPHDGSAPTSVNTLTGQSAEPEPAAVAEATEATAAAGVTVATQPAAEPAPAAV